MHLHEKLVIIKSILALHPEGAVFETIKDIRFVRDFYGNMFWMTTSSKTSHIRELVTLQKTNDLRRKRNTAAIKPCNFKEDHRTKKKIDRNHPYKRQPQENRTKPNYRNITPPEFISVSLGGKQNPYNPHLYAHQMIGDDFFLSVAKLELGYLTVPGQRIQQSGLCVSGQTVRGAIDRLCEMPVGDVDKQVIINLGSVDLMQGRDVLDIQTDYNRLLVLLKEMGIQAIVTTLPPIANHSYLSSMQHNWMKLNVFLRRQPLCIDICELMMQNGRILYSCFQGEAKYVTGSSRPHVLWNKIGRQRILKAMKIYLGDTFC
uniref:OSK domain-containing protein n=1 Tax=Phlebotomus papatasi TaxID=29031 RepID=A0A1B0CZN4_PHLPP